jgi:hypothetical protein
MIKSAATKSILSAFHQLYHAHQWFRQSAKKAVVMKMGDG